MSSNAIILKSKNQVSQMREGGKIAHSILLELVDHLDSFENSLELDKFAEVLLKKYNVFSAFKGLYDYNYVTCISINDVIIHGIPSTKSFKLGDLVKIDIGIIFNQVYIDHAVTCIYREKHIDFDSSKFQEEIKIRNCAKLILDNVLNTIKPGDSTLNISKLIEKLAFDNGYFPNYDYVGHGVGTSLHEQPDIFCFYEEYLPGFKLVEGMTLAIEPMFSIGSGDTFIDPVDKFSVRIKGGGLGAFFEDTVYVGSEKIEVLTK